MSLSFIQKHTRKGAVTQMLSQLLFQNKRCLRDSQSAIRLNVSFTASFLMSHHTFFRLNTRYPNAKNKTM